MGKKWSPCFASERIKGIVAIGCANVISGIADPLNGHIDEFRLAHVQRCHGGIATT